ncbi:MAG: tetratricopeptide repeat protein [Chloroflexota bacterium]
MRGFLWHILLVFLTVSCSVSPSARNNSGNNALRRGDAAQAITSYHLSVVDAPDRAIPYFNLGVAYLESGDFQRAEAALFQALRHEPETIAADIYFGLGEAAFMQRKYSEAISHYREVLLLRPGDTDAQYNLQLAIQSVPTATVTFTPTPTTTVTADTQQITSTPTSTPTPSPLAPDANQATPTPSPESDTQQDNLEPTPDSDEPQQDISPMSEAAAAELLNDVQQDQGILFSPDSEVFYDEALPAKDW